MSFDALTQNQLNDQVDLDALLGRLMDEVTRRLGADRGTLYLVDHARGELVSRVADLPELAEIRLRLGEGIAGWVARTGEAVFVPRGADDARHASRIDSQTGYQTQSLLAVPIRAAGEAILGVLQVLNKPGGFDEADAARLTRLGREIGAALERTSLGAQLRPGHALPLSFRFNHIVGASEAMGAVFERTARAARTEAIVLLRGESGTGKELIARAVHVNSPRAAAPFVKVDCAALPSQLIENELFGHERGAFTSADAASAGQVAAAEGGTLFLDEIGELPLAVQGKILRLLQDKTYQRVGGARVIRADVRFVCATHRDLERAVAEGRFRQDLYYRSRVIEIRIPPLRARGPKDLDRLIDYFFLKYKQAHDRPELEITAAARARLHDHSWPGNVRELENALSAAVILSPGDSLDVSLLSLNERLYDTDVDLFTSPIKSMRAIESDYVRFVLNRCEGNRSAAARVLGIGRNTLLRYLKE
ncbi:sigma-54-dependent Fis family transcriptional regulator [Myxococcota bacterium]|nr:sigma-54-dependent Fis family transcriptional regulator [Myxococcota bacterium]MBU1430472.1 sigma-54-dependent Fis family transcriptional regulator [Myxococcota bacterium]MBU1898828.1 sigma-54-dependent Fis family transcriptional regulator [Myxococcota bacterium]